MTTQKNSHFNGLVSTIITTDNNHSAHTFPAHLLTAINNPFRCSFRCVLLLDRTFWKQCTVHQYRSYLSDQPALEIRVGI